MVGMRVALTGGIASGKSTVADMLAGHGAVIIDADLIAREVVEPGSEGIAKVVECFGEGILADDGTLDRARLGSIVFRDDAARADLNAIVHPLVRRRAEQLEAEAPEDALVVQVIPLLVEAGIVDGFDEVIVVDVPEEVQLRRLMARNGFTEGEAWDRIRSQASRAQRLAVATHVIDNAGSAAGTHSQVAALWQHLSAAPPGATTDRRCVPRGRP